MSLIAAFLWNKSPKCSISTMIFDTEHIRFISSPKLHFFPPEYLAFRKAAKAVIKEFFSQIENLYQREQQEIIIEFKIVFHVYEVPYLLPAIESKFVYKLFMYHLRKAKKKFKFLTIKPQLRRRLSGKQLLQFKKELRALHLVSRKKDTGFEYHLWTVALHATAKTFMQKLQQIRNKLFAKTWNEKY